MRAGEVVQGLSKHREKEIIDVLLIYCDLFYQIEYTNINMGLIYIATALKKAGFRVEVLSFRDLFGQYLRKLRWGIAKKSPSIVGFYTMSDNIELVENLSAKIKSWIPSVKIVVGGPLASALGEKMLENENFDMVVTGEGEHAMEIIARAICRGEGRVEDAPGVILKLGGKIIRGKDQCPIKDLDSLPFPDKEYFKGQQVFHVVSGRGCPYKCSFCFQAGHGLNFRLRSADNVLKEVIDNLNSGSFVSFEIVDDAFIIDRERCLKFARGLTEYRRKTGRKFVFFCQGRVNVLDKYPEMIKELAGAGLARIQLGIESGDEDVLKAYRKEIDLSQVRRVVECIAETRSMVAAGGFILGGPFETLRTFQKTVALASDLIDAAPGAFEASAGFLGAYPGTEIAENPKKFGLKMVEPDFVKGFSLSDVQFVTDNLDLSEVRALKKAFDAVTLSAMKKNLHRIPRELLRKHFVWAKRHGVFSLWYSRFLSTCRTLIDYFKYIESPLFMTFDKLPLENIREIYPMRVVENREYLRDGSLVLMPSVKEIILTDPNEILAYELCSGKLTIAQVADRIKAERMPDADFDEIYSNLLSPLFSRLEETYHIIFHE